MKNTNTPVTMPTNTPATKAQKAYIKLLIERDNNFYDHVLRPGRHTTMHDISIKYVNNIDPESLTKDQASATIDHLKKGTIVKWLMGGGDPNWDRPGWMEGAKRTAIFHLLRVNVSKFDDKLDRLVEKGRFYEE